MTKRKAFPGANYFFCIWEHCLTYKHGHGDIHSTESKLILQWNSATFSIGSLNLKNHSLLNPITWKAAMLTLGNDFHFFVYSSAYRVSISHFCIRLCFHGHNLLHQIAFTAYLFFYWTFRWCQGLCKHKKHCNTKTLYIKPSSPLSTSFELFLWNNFPIGRLLDQRRWASVTLQIFLPHSSPNHFYQFTMWPRMTK